MSYALGLHTPEASVAGTYKLWDKWDAAEEPFESDGRPEGDPAQEPGPHEAEAVPPPAPSAQPAQPDPAPVRYKVSFQPQGATALRALTGKKIKNVGIVKVSIRSFVGPSLDLDTVDLEQIAAGHGLTLLDKRVGVRIVQNAKNMNWKKIGLDAGGIVLDLFTGLTVSGVVKATEQIKTALVGSGIAARRVGNTLRERLPDITWTELLLDGPVVFAANGRAGGLMTVVWKPGLEAIVVEVR